MAVYSQELQPGTYVFTFKSGDDSISREVTLTEPTLITASVTRSGTIMSYAISGLPVGGSYTCTCPDFTKSVGGVIRSPYSSEQFDRNWSASEAGGGTCKHIISTKLIRGEEVPVPTDVPILDTSKKSKSFSWGKWPKL